MARTSCSASSSLQRRGSNHYHIKRKINQNHSLIIRQLPPDVMSIIFEFCLPDFVNHKLSPSNNEEPEDLSIPLCLGAICSFWREIAWSTPSLWSSLVVRVPSKVCKHDSHIAIVTGVAQEWLARSGQLPLSIRIISEPYGRKSVSALADIINQYSPRWSDLDLYVPPYFYKYFYATVNHAPILKSIRFHCSPITDAMNLKFQLTCPRLERASLSYSRIDIAWDNLTHLTLHSMIITDSFLILRKTPRLVFCKVSGSYSRTRGPNIGPPVLSPLRSLQLLVTLTRFAKDFLNNLIAPHLEEFSLPNYFNPSRRFITSFLRRSACSLRTFTITVNISKPHFKDFMNLLQSMPSLNTLSMISINSFGNTEDYDIRKILKLVTKVLVSQNTSFQQDFLPNLEILEYTGKLHLRPGNNDYRYSLPPPGNAVHGPLHLLKLDLHPATRIPKNMISYFSTLVERGVTVNVCSKSENILQSSIDYYKCRKNSSCRD